MSTKKLNKFVELSKQLVNFKNYSSAEQEEFVSNAIAIYRNNDLGSSVITTQVAKYFLFLVNPRSIAAVDKAYKERNEDGPSTFRKVI